MTTPIYHVTTKVDGRTVGTFQQDIPDPFIRQTVILGWRDLLRGLLHRQLTVEVLVGSDTRTVTRVLELNPDYLGPSDSPSRKAWNARIQETLGDML